MLPSFVSISFQNLNTMKRIFRIAKVLMPLVAIFILGSSPSCVQAQDNPSKKVHIRIASGDDGKEVILDTIVDNLDKELINSFLKVSGSNLRLVDVRLKNGEEDISYGVSLTTEDDADIVLSTDNGICIEEGDNEVWSFNASTDEGVKVLIKSRKDEGNAKKSYILRVTENKKEGKKKDKD